MNGEAILSVKYYTTWTSDYTTAEDVDFYLKEVEENIVSTTFVDRASATTVYHGVVEFIKNAETGKCEATIEFDTPFEYHGGNLLVGCDNTTKSSYKSIKFLGQAIEGATITGHNDDALANVTTGTQQKFLPKTTFTYGTPPSCLKPSGLAVSNIEDISATISWTSDKSAWNLEWKEASATDWNTEAVSGTPSKALSGLSAATTYNVRVQADCGADGTSEFVETSFTTSPCAEANKKAIRYEFTDSYGDGWSSAAIKVAHTATGAEIARLTLSSASAGSGELALCCGEEYTFSWIACNQWDSECGFIFYDINDNVIFEHAEGTAPSGELFAYTMDCTEASCKKPGDVKIDEITGHTASISWTAKGEETAWEIAYKTAIAEDFSVKAASTNPYVLTGLNAETAYVVKVRASCGKGEANKSDWSSEVNFTTAIANPAPTNLFATDITTDAATLTWEGSADSYEVQYTKKSELPDDIIVDFDNTSVNDWSAIDADGDGASWQLINNDAYSHSGTKCIYSESYSANPDQYLVSPKLALGGSISFYACGYPGYSSYIEHFGVAVSVTGNTDAADFTMVAEFNSTSSYALYTVDLSAFAGQEGYIAIRHFDCSAAYLFIDDIMIVQGDNATWNIEDNIAAQEFELTGLNDNTTYVARVRGHLAGEDDSKWSERIEFTTIANCIAPTNVEVNDIKAHSATLTWTAAEGQDQWEVALKAAADADFAIESVKDEAQLDLENLAGATTFIVKVRAICGIESQSDWSAEIEFATPDPNPAPTNLEASEITHNSALISWEAEGDSFDLQYVKKSEFDAAHAGDNNFDEGSLGTWTTIDADGDGYNWGVGNSSNNYVHSGEYTAVSASYVSSGALTPDNYLVSPKVVLGGSISFWALGQDPDWAAEHFGVAVSVAGNTDAADFTMIEGAAWDASANWEQHIVDLSAFAGQEGYVAIRHFDCTDMFRLNIDDIVIEQPGMDPVWNEINGITEKSQALDALDEETAYAVRVRSHLTDEPDSDWSAILFFETPKDATGIENVLNEGECTKILRDGQIFILRGEKVYTITGAEAK